MCMFIVESLKRVTAYKVWAIFITNVKIIENIFFMEEMSVKLMWKIHILTIFIFFVIDQIFLY